MANPTPSYSFNAHNNGDPFSQNGLNMGWSLLIDPLCKFGPSNYYSLSNKYIEYPFKGQGFIIQLYTEYSDNVHTIGLHYWIGSPTDLKQNRPILDEKINYISLISNFYWIEFEFELKSIPPSHFRCHSPCSLVHFTGTDCQVFSFNWILGNNVKKGYFKERGNTSFSGLGWSNIGFNCIVKILKSVIDAILDILVNVSCNRPGLYLN